jgi:hypothetical protein
LSGGVHIRFRYKAILAGTASISTVENKGAVPLNEETYFESVFFLPAINPFYRFYFNSTFFVPHEI